MEEDQSMRMEEECMEGDHTMSMEEEKEQSLFSFLEITCGRESHSSAEQYLQVTGWDLAAALQLFCSDVEEEEEEEEEEDLSFYTDDGSSSGGPGDKIRPAPPVVDKEMKESEKLTSPLALMYRGSFNNAKEAAALENKWLIINVQSNRELSSDMLNRDTWSHQTLAQTITSYFIFWQVYNHTIEGEKFGALYQLNEFPAILVIDPTRGRKMLSWKGIVDPDTLMDGLSMFMDGGPKNYRIKTHIRQTSIEDEDEVMPSEDDEEELEEMTDSDEEEVMPTKDNDNYEDMLASVISFENADRVDKEESQIDMVEEKKPAYPLLPVEPKIGTLCRVAVRLPGGHWCQRNFLNTDPIQLLWSFCSSHLDEYEKLKPFQLIVPSLGESRLLDYHSTLTFGESGLANTLISLTWE